MTSRSLERWQQLRAVGIVEGDAPPAVTATSSWAVTAVMGAAAWLSAILLLFFLFLALEDLLSSAATAIITGLVIVGAASAAMRYAPERLFIVQLAIAFSLAGQVLVAFGIFKLDLRPGAFKWLLFAAFEAVLVAVVAQPAHRVLATFGAVTAIFMALYDVELVVLFLPALLAAFVVAHAFILGGSPRHGLWASAGTGIALALVVAMVAGREFPLLTSASALGERGLRLLSTALLVGLGGVAALIVARDAGASLRSRVVVVAIGAAMLVAAISGFALPAVPCALVMLMLAFAAGRPVLIALVIVALLAALAYHYYQLDATLLQKSATLGALGVVLLGVRAMLRRTLMRENGRDA